MQENEGSIDGKKITSNHISLLAQAMSLNNYAGWKLSFRRYLKLPW